MPLNLPTFLTWLRMLAIPMLVGIFYLPIAPMTMNIAATALFVPAQLSG